jgi:hypothetical protein
MIINDFLRIDISIFQNKFAQNKKYILNVLHNLIKNPRRRATGY